MKKKDAAPLVAEPPSNDVRPNEARGFVDRTRGDISKEIERDDFSVFIPLALY